MVKQSKEEFIREYILNRATGHKGGMDALSCASDAADVYDKYLKTEDKKAKKPQVLNESKE